MWSPTLMSSGTSDTLKANKVSVVDLVSTDKLTHEIYDSSRTAGATGGLLGLAVSAGVDATINSRRTVAFAPILTALGNYDTKKIFAAKLKGLQGPSFDSDIRVNATAMPVNAFPKPPLREPKVIIEDIIALDKESEAILAKIQELL